MGKPSCALAWGLVLAVTIALGCSDHAVPTMPEFASVDPATTSTPAPLDLSDDSSIAMDTAKVAPGMVGGLVGTTVLDEKIVKDGHSVGALIGRPTGPTDNAGGVDAKRTPAQPTEPEAEVAPKPVSGGVMSDGWCLVSIWYNIHTGEIVAAEVLYCWNGNGEGGGGGGNNNQTQRVSFALTCTSSVTRGSNGRCSVSAVGEDGEIDPDAFSFSWSSSTGAAASGQGMNTWQGRATETAKITVSVGQFSESRNINVRPRSGWRVSPFSASITYDNSLADDVFGRHRVEINTPSIPTPVAGSGPWNGRYMAGRPPTVSNRIWIQANYTLSGPPHPGANGVCSSVPASSNYYRVNTNCGSWRNAISWRSKVILHERDHEGEYNACLRSSTARGVMDRMEEVVGGSRGRVASDMLSMWHSFYQNTLRAQAVTYGRAISTGSSTFWHYYRGWSNGSIRVAAHGRRSNC